MTARNNNLFDWRNSQCECVVTRFGLVVAGRVRQTNFDSWSLPKTAHLFPIPWLWYAATTVEKPSLTPQSCDKSEDAYDYFLLLFVALPEYTIQTLQSWSPEVPCVALRIVAPRDMKRAKMGIFTAKMAIARAYVTNVMSWWLATDFGLGTASWIGWWYVRDSCKNSHTKEKRRREGRKSFKTWVAICWFTIQWRPRTREL